MADEQDDSQKTEEPTQKRLDDARKKGQLPVSRELNHWFMYLACAMAVGMLAPSMMSNLQSSLTVYLASSHQVPSDAAGIGGVLVHAVLDIGKALALPVLLFLVAGLAGTAIQTGLNVSVEGIKPKFEKISPMAGLKRQFSMKALVEFIKGLLKLTVVSIVIYYMIEPILPGVEHFTQLPIPYLLDEVQSLSLRVIGGALGVVTVIAAMDLLYQRFSFMQQMRMTKQEIKDEYKNTEGDPVIRSRLKQIRMERARKRMMAAVPTADVVITNPTHYAVALKYDPQKNAAPSVVAKGVDLIALKIREIATANDVPIMENPPLARALFAAVEVDQEVPQDHYRAVAEIISYVFRLKNKVMPTVSP